MAKYLVVCGHGQGDPGAGGNGISERDWTRNPLAVAIDKYRKKLKSNTIDIYDKSKDMFQQTKQGWGAYSVSTSYSSVTELHLDASSSSSSSGGHVIIRAGYQPDMRDLALANVVHNMVGWHPAYRSARGISYRNDLLNLNVFARRGISYRLIELGFITSKKDTDKLKANYDLLGKQLVEAITGEKISESSTSPSTPTIKKKRGEVMVLFSENGKVYWLVGNKYTYISNPDDLKRVQEMMAKQGYETWIHTNKVQIKYLKRLATEAK